MKEYDIPLEHFQKEKRIVLLSDIHVGTFVDVRQLRKIISTVNEIQADMVFIAGDLFDVEAFACCKKEEIAAELQNCPLREMFMRFWEIMIQSLKQEK